MGKVEKFEDLIAWQKARELNASIFQQTANEFFSKDLAFRNQVRRASLSIMANIAEGFERGSATEFHHFLFIAKASCAELRSHLYAASDAGFLSKEEFVALLQQSEEAAKIIGGLRTAVAKRRMKR